MCMETKPRTPQNLTILTANDSLKKFLEKNIRLEKMKTEELKQRYNLEEVFLNKLKESYTNYNAGYIKDFLADNVTYDSIWVIEQITSKTDYCNYLEQKLNAMKETNTVINFRIMYEKNGRPHLIFTPKNNNSFGCFTVETASNLIKAIHLTPADFYDLEYKYKKKYGKN